MAFEPLQEEAQPQPTGKTRFEPLSPTYNYTQPDDGGDETIMFHGGTEVKAPAGTGRVFTEIQNDDAFDPAPSTTLDETSAVFEKQAAYVALVANAYGLVPDDGIADFVASRSKALAHAQKNQPEYMKDFQAQFQNAKGFWETAGVMLSHPRAIGRTAITQSPNSAMPLITTYLGAQGGALAGGAVGSVVPGPGTATGAVIGGIAGGVAGSVPGGAMVEIGSTIDQLMTESGVDVTDAKQVMGALQNEKLMADIKIKAEKKGITTASVDALFQVVGGRFLKAFGGAGGLKKVGAAAGDVAIQSAGEFTGEAAGQYRAFGKVDYKDAAMEAVSSLAQSAGQTAIGATTGKAKAKPAEAVAAEALAPAPAMPDINPDTAEPMAVTEAPATAVGEGAIKADISPAPDAMGDAFEPAIAAAPADAADDIPFDIPALKSPEAKAALETTGLDLQAMSPKQARDFGAALDGVARNVPNAIEHIRAQEGKGYLPLPQKRPQSLSEFLIENGGLRLDTGEAARFTRKETPALKGVAKKTGKLGLDEARELAVQAGFITDVADETMPTMSTEQDLLDALEAEAQGQDIVRGSEVGKVMERRAIEEYNTQLDQMYSEQYPGVYARGISDAFRRGVAASKRDVKESQTAVIDAIEKSGLSLEDRAKFIRQVKNIDSAAKAEKVLPDIQGQVESLLDASARRDTIKKISRIAKMARRSQTIAADMASRIEEMVSEIDLKKRSDTTTQRLEATLEHFNNHPDERAPAYVMKELERLSKKPVADISTDELTSFLGQLRRITNQGRKKQELKAAAAQRRQQKRLSELDGKIVPMVSRPLATASIGERISLMDEVKNKYLTAANYARGVSLAMNPMDVVFDMIDNNADYKGPSHTIFKKAIDKSFSRYLDLKENTTRDVKNLADKLELDDKNFERIGVYAAAQQEGGMKKLEASGLTKAEVEAVTLTKEEKQFYDLMREKLDAMFPAINEVMIDVYNKNVEQVGDYFPFMTDFESMDNSPIQDMLGNDAPSLIPTTAEAAIKGKKKAVERGFTKSRTGGAQAIRIDAMNVFLQHVDNAAYLVEMSRDIKELGELAQSKQFGAIAGDMTQQFVTDWIDLLARKGKAQNRVAALDALRVNAGAAVLGYKLSSILIQPTALADGAALIGGDYVARGVKQVATSPEWRAFLKANLPEIRERVGDDPAYLDMGGKSAIAHAREAGFWALKNVDLLSASSVAAGAYIRSVESRGGVVDLNNVDPAAVQEAQLYLRRTQSSSFAKDTPMVISSGKLTGNASLDKLIFQFQSFMLNRWSIIKHDIAKVGIGRGKTAQALNATAFLLLATSMEIGIRRLSKEMIAAMLGGDDLDPWDKTIGKEAVQTAIGTMPIVGNLAGSLEYGSIPVPSVALLNGIVQKAYYAGKSKSTDKQIKNASSAAILLLGVGLGVPGTLQVEQLSRKLQTDKKNSKKGF